MNENFCHVIDCAICLCVDCRWRLREGAVGGRGKMFSVEFSYLKFRIIKILPQLGSNESYCNCSKACLFVLEKIEVGVANFNIATAYFDGIHETIAVVASILYTQHKKRR